jgi:hypothetical protein
LKFWTLKKLKKKKAKNTMLKKLSQLLTTMLFALFANFALADGDNQNQQQQGGQQQQQKKEGQQQGQDNQQQSRRFVLRRREGEGGGTPALLQKEREDQAKKDKEAQDLRDVESTVEFNHGIVNFVKDNANLLPAEVKGVVERAMQEKYDTAADKARAIRESVVVSFFALQSNEDLLTPAQKRELDEWRKLAKNARASKVTSIYQNIFEPTLQQLRNVKRAEEVSRGRMGIAVGTDADKAYAEKFQEASFKKFFRKG